MNTRCKALLRSVRPNRFHRVIYSVQTTCLETKLQHNYHADDRHDDNIHGGAGGGCGGRRGGGGGFGKFECLWFRTVEAFDAVIVT